MTKPFDQTSPSNRSGFLSNSISNISLSGSIKYSFSDITTRTESDSATKVKKIPYVNEAKLKAAIVGLENVIDNWK